MTCNKERLREGDLRKRSAQRRPEQSPRQRSSRNTYTDADGDGYIMCLEATVHELCVINYANRLITVPSGPYEITLISV